MDKVEAWMVVAVFAAVSALIAAIASLIKNIETIKTKTNEPFTRLESKITESNKSIENRLDIMQKDINFMFKSQSMMLEHMATGNDIEALKKQHSLMNEYLIETRRS